jgi:hypothetical protein
LVLVCPFHHRQHHRGLITIRGPGHAVTVLDRNGEEMHAGSVARAPRGSPPTAAPYAGPIGERCNWYWYHPFEPHEPVDH